MWKRQPDRMSRARTKPLLIATLCALSAAGVAYTATSGAGAASAAPPSNTARPSISGRMTQGYTLTASPGNWAGSQPIRVAYRWMRCQAATGDGCVPIPDAEQTTYEIRAVDVRHRLRIRVTAMNADGSDVAFSPASAVVADAVAPANTSRPTISGTPRQGSTLNASRGGWRGDPPPTFAYRWLRCDAATGTGCVPIPDTEQPTYLLREVDVGRRLRVRVTARNVEGSDAATSLATPLIARAGNAPATTAPPSISGTAQEGQTLTANRGQWSGDQPITFVYQWQRCPAAGEPCGNIPGATGQTYRLVGADVGHRIRLQVRGQNQLGVNTALSGVTAVIAPAGPAGQIRLPDGRISIPVTSVAPPQRLVVSGLDFRPNPLRNRDDLITARLRVTDTRGFVVRGALLFVIPLPYDWTTQPAETLTGTDGWATVTMRATRRLPSRGAIVMFVRARKPGDFVLTGVSTRRLVQMLVAMR
jgi:hypothetical protein